MAKKKLDNIVKIVKLQGNAPKKWGGGEYIPTDIGMAADIPAIPLATPLVVIFIRHFLALKMHKVKRRGFRDTKL